jgi:hypothetical protein
MSKMIELDWNTYAAEKLKGYTPAGQKRGVFVFKNRRLLVKSQGRFYAIDGRDFRKYGQQEGAEVTFSVATEDGYERAINIEFAS